MHDVYVNIDLGELLRFGVPFAIVVGWLSGRLLGVRRGWGRAFVAGLIGWLGGVIVAASIEGTDDLSTIAAPTLFFGVLFAMFASIAFDLLLRPKRAAAPAARVVAPPDRRDPPPLGAARALPRDHPPRPGTWSHEAALRLGQQGGDARLRPPPPPHP